MQTLKTVIWFFILTVVSSQLQADGAYSLERGICGWEQEANLSIYYCLDLEQGDYSIRRIDREADRKAAISAQLIDQGFKILPFDSFLDWVASGHLEEIAGSWWQLFFFRPGQFNNLRPQDPTIVRLKKLATTLHRVGVCQLPVVRANYRNINIRTSNDVLLHFLCIANSESVFGLRNIGLGGRGPWGINPIHTTRRGLCYQQAPRAVLRNASGQEIKDSARYLSDPAVLEDNARCALVLYRHANGFASWGTSRDNWGSNRHCAASVRGQLDFKKFLGELASCPSPAPAPEN